jgi:SAM-dependent methyltransferase
VCRDQLVVLAERDGDGVLGHTGGFCTERYPVIGRIPRLLRAEARLSVAARHPDWFADAEWGRWLGGWPPETTSPRADLALVERFDREWARFHSMPAGERARVFTSYFDVVDPASLRPGSVVLDAGCGSGRWSYELARRGTRVVAMDLGLSIEVAARNTSGLQVQCVQADIRDTPFRAETFDFACSLGVLHHVPETDLALAAICGSIKPSGAMLLYLYYALETRPSWYRALFKVSDGLRRILSASPQAVTQVITTGIAAVVYWPLARSAGLARRFGRAELAEALPLSFYSDLSFQTMRNDSLDRFGTGLEKRYTAAEVIQLMSDAGLREVRLAPGPPFWHAAGRRPPTAPGRPAVGNRRP